MNLEIPITQPTLPPWDLVEEAYGAFYETGMITNGPMVRQLESEIQNTLHVSQAVAVSSCTSGLMLALKYLDVTKKVAIPSFTFFATAHSVIWNSLEPVFVDIDAETWNLSTEALRVALGNDPELNAVMPVHIFGNPCEVYGLEEARREYGIKLAFDSAHAIGSKIGDKWVGCFGDAEVFSLTPTKLMAAGEGGIITTQDSQLGESLRAGRNYGNTGDYDPESIGLSARMSEFHAALAIESFHILEENVQRRNKLAEQYKELLSGIAGIRFQRIKEGNRTTYKDFSIAIDKEDFGMDRDELSLYLSEAGVDTRKYFYPPVHRIKAYWEKWGKQYDDALPVTNKLAQQALSLPMWSHMEEELVERVCERIAHAHENAENIRSEILKKSE